MNRLLKEGMRYTYLGFSMVVIMGLFAYGGYRLDRYFGSSPKLTVTGVILGVLFGMGYFLLEIIRLIQDAQEPYEDKGPNHENHSE